MVQNAFKLHSTTCIPLIRYKSTFLQLIVVVSETLWQIGCAKWKAEENSATISTLVGFA